eukprot:3311570-Lingulodinium_polyedra.AAC.1
MLFVHSSGCDAARFGRDSGATRKRSAKTNEQCTMRMHSEQCTVGSAQSAMHNQQGTISNAQ